MDHRFSVILLASGILLVSCAAAQTQQSAPVGMTIPIETPTIMVMPTASSPTVTFPPPTPTTMSDASLFDSLVQPFAKEAKQRRAERAKNDSGYAKRIDKELNEGRVNFLLFGYGETHEPPAVEGVIIGSHSIISYDYRTRKVDIISLTHDISAPEIERAFHVGGIATRIDQAYRLGGFDFMREVLEDATGLSLDFQIAFKDSLLIDLVDNLFGAIEIDLPVEFEVAPYYLDGIKYVGASFAKGKQKLNGMQVIQLVKATTIIQDRSLERNVRKIMVFRALLEAVNRNCSDGRFWLRTSAFMIGEPNSGRIAYDFDPIPLAVNNIRDIIPLAQRFVTREGSCEISGSAINKTIYVVDSSVGDGGVQWLARSSPNDEGTLRSDAGWALEVPLNANSNGDLVTEYWGSVRSLIKQSLLKQ